MVQTVMISKPLLNFDQNFSFKFLDDFTGQLKKLKLVMLMAKGFGKYHHLFNLQILAAILFFHDWDSSILNIKVLKLKNKIFSKKYIMQE